MAPPRRTRTRAPRGSKAVAVAPEAVEEPTPPEKTPSEAPEDQFVEPSSSSSAAPVDPEPGGTSTHRLREEHLHLVATNAFYEQIEQQLSTGESEIRVTWDRPGPVPEVPPLPVGRKLFIQRVEGKKIGRPTRPEVPVVQKDGDLPEFVNVVQKDVNDMKEMLEKRKNSYTFQPKKFRNKQAVPYEKGILKGYSWDGDIDTLTQDQNKVDKKEEKGKKGARTRKGKKAEGGEAAPEPSTSSATVPEAPVVPETSAAPAVAENGETQKETEEQEGESPPEQKKKTVEWIPPWPVNPAHVVAKPRGANGTAVEVTAEVCMDNDTNRIQMVYKMHAEDPNEVVEKPKKKRVRKPRPPGTKTRSRKRKNQDNAETEAPGPSEKDPDAVPSAQFSDITSAELRRHYKAFTNTEVSLECVTSFANVRDVDLLNLSGLKRSLARFDVDEHGRPTLGAQRRQMHPEILKSYKLQRYGSLVEEYSNSLEKFDALVNPDSEEYGGGPMAVALGRKTLKDLNLKEYSFQKMVFEVMGLQDEYKQRLKDQLHKTPIEDPYHVPYQKCTMPAFVMEDVGIQTDIDPDYDDTISPDELMDQEGIPDDRNYENDADDEVGEEEEEEEDDGKEEFFSRGKYHYDAKRCASRAASVVEDQIEEEEPEKIVQNHPVEEEKPEQADDRVEIPPTQETPAPVGYKLVVPTTFEMTSDVEDEYDVRTPPPEPNSEEEEESEEDEKWIKLAKKYRERDEKARIERREAFFAAKRQKKLEEEQRNAELALSSTVTPDDSKSVDATVEMRFQESSSGLCATLAANIEENTRPFKTSEITKNASFTRRSPNSSIIVNVQHGHLQQVSASIKLPHAPSVALRVEAPADGAISDGEDAYLDVVA